MVEFYSNFYWWNYFAIFLIIFFGLPHGAFDAAVGISMGYFNSVRNKIIFLFSYSLMSIFIIVLWYFFPAPILLFFLLVSIFHFGLGDLEWDNKLSYYLSGYFKGGLIIFGISFCNIIEVNSIYFILIDDSTSLIWMFLKIGAFIWIMITPIYFYINRKNLKRKFFFNLIILSFIIFFLPPLVSFALYFCFIHSFNHVKRIIPTLKLSQTNKSILRIFIFFTVISWIIGLIILLLLNQHNSFSESLLRLTFIGLAALTFPHMILVDLFFRPKLKI